MSKIKLILLVIVLLVIAGGTIVYLTFDLDRFLYRVAKKEFQKDSHDTLQRDGLEILFAGTGSPRHSSKRGQACLGIIAAGQFILIDAGQGCMGRLTEMEAPYKQIISMLLNVFHLIFILAFR